MNVALAAALDAVLIAACYLAAVGFRLGGRAENAAAPELAVALVIVAAIAQVGGNALVRAYRRPTAASPRTLVAMLAPAVVIAVGLVSVNLAGESHPVPYASIPPAMFLGWAAECAVHLRSRWPALVRIATEGTVVEKAPLGQGDVSGLFLPPTATIRDAIAVIDRDVARIALIATDSRRLVGCVTDGDVRRAILAGHELSAPITEAMSTGPVVAPIDSTDVDVLALMHRHGVRQVPLIDGEFVVHDIRVLELLTGEITTPAPVMIMAGGLGTRLGVVTRGLPKPLVRVGGEPVLELLVKDLASHGFRTIILAVNYKADLIQEHFGDGARFGVDLAYVREDEPMGTAGAIRLAKNRLAETFIVMNADLVTRVNYRELLAFHKQHDHDMTLGVIESTFQLRYGLVETSGTRVTAIREKPSLRHFVNAGIYVLEPKMIGLVPSGQRYDMDELIAAALQRNDLVGCFPIHEYWTDIGEPDDLRRAAIDLGERRARRAASTRRSTE